MTVTEVNKKWAEFIGFEYEGTLKKYIDDEDYYIFGRQLWQ